MVTRTVIYDIDEKMGDPKEAIDAYSTALDLSWMRAPWPGSPMRAAMLSADRDLDPAEIPRLVKTYDGAVGDWESGAIAWVAARHKVPLVIVRAVTDVVTPSGGEAYGGTGVFEARTATLMKKLLSDFEAWLRGSGARR